VRTGRLLASSCAPLTGEAERTLAATGRVVVKQVLSGQLAGPVDYRQDEDEWALVVEGSAVLQVAGSQLELRVGDWVWLPAGIAHRLVRTEPGTSWVTVHIQK
jgi:uncharacterized cupin superfamily protein